MKILNRNLWSLARYFAVRDRGRLMRDYFLISVLLVVGGLVTSGAVEIYFSYIESREQLALVQKEIAAGAAGKIERFVQEIHNILRGATKSPAIAPERLTSEFRLELEKLLLIAPAVTEAIVFNEQGAIRVQASRRRTVFPDGDRDFANSAPFKQVKQGKPYFGPVYFDYGSEPYMTIAVPIERFAGDVIGVLHAEVNLKYIGDVISSITVGKAGYAYAMSCSGELIAHPDISLVLQRRMVDQLAIFKAACGPAATQPTQSGIIAPNLQGKDVLSAFAQIPIPGVDWAIVVDLPVQEVYETIYASLFRTAALLLIGLGFALIASFYVARRVLRPIGILQDGVAHFADNLSSRIELKTGDELEGLADEFNKLADRLQESYANLEQKVEDRTLELGEKNKQLEAAAESKERFFNYVAHDMRTPLISIKGFTDLVLRKTEGKIEQLQEENLRKVLVSSKHLESLVDDLLDLAKGKRKEVNIQAFKLDEVLRFATDTVEPMLKDKNIKLITEMASDIPTMKSDCAMLKKIVLNLLSNAAKYTEAGEIKIAAACDNGTLTLVVSDTGIGMKAKALQYIFDEFRQVEMSTTQRYPSTGLGLAIVKLFTNLLGGDVTVESEEGKGSTFTIVMPMELQPLTVKSEA